MKSKYTIDYFISKFESIPEDKWTTGIYQDEEDRFCVLGHCGFRSTIDDSNYFCTEINEEGDALIKLMSPFFPSPPLINDGQGDYINLGKTPKARILNALNKIKMKG